MLLVRTITAGVHSGVVCCTRFCPRPYDFAETSAAINRKRSREDSFFTFGAVSGPDDSFTVFFSIHSCIAAAFVGLSPESLVIRAGGL